MFIIREVSLWSQLVFHIKYNFTNRVEISETDEIEYTMDISITNKIDTKKTSHLYAKVEEANGEAGHFYYNEQIPFSLGFNDEWTNTIVFRTPKEAHAKIYLGVQYNGEPYYSEPVYLLSFDRPTISDAKIVKDVYAPTIVKITWDFIGDASIIIADETTITGTGISSSSILFNPLKK